MLDGAVLPRRVHGLKHQQQCPAVVRVQPILQFRHGLDPERQILFCTLFVALLEIADVRRIDVLQAERFSRIHLVSVAEAPRGLDDLVEFHVPTIAFPCPPGSGDADSCAGPLSREVDKRARNKI